MADDPSKIATWHDVTIPATAPEGTFGVTLRDELSSAFVPPDLPPVPEAVTGELAAWAREYKDAMDLYLLRTQQRLKTIADNCQSFVPLILKTTLPGNGIFSFSPQLPNPPDPPLSGQDWNGYALAAMTWDVIIPLRQFVPDNCVAALINVGNYHSGSKPGQSRLITIEPGDGSNVGRGSITASQLVIHQSSHKDDHGVALDNRDLQQLGSGIVGVSADEWKSIRIRQAVTDPNSFFQRGLELTSWHPDLTVWLQGYFVGEREYQQAKTALVNATVVIEQSGSMTVPSAAKEHPYNVSRGVFIL